MAGRRETDWIGSFNFKIEIGGVAVAGFTHCAGLKNETEVFEYAEGGENSKVRKLIGKSKVSNLVLKKGLILDDSLWKWRDEIQNAEGEITRKDGSVIVCNDDNAEIARFNFFEAWPIRWDGPEFDSQSSQAACETLELAIERLARAK